MDQPLAVMGTPGLSLVGLIFIGGLAGWIAGMILGIRHGLLTNILIGIAGSYIGSEIADTLNVVVRNSMGHFLAALIGSVIVIFIWQKIRENPRDPIR